MAPCLVLSSPSHTPLLNSPPLTHRPAALATEDPTPDLLTHKPHGRDEPLISRKMWKHIITQGMFQVGGAGAGRWEGGQQRRIEGVAGQPRCCSAVAWRVQGG